MKNIIPEKKEDITFAMTYYKFLETSHKIEEKLKKALKPFGLTHAQLNVMYLLAKAHPETLNANDINESIIVGKPDVTRLVDRLVNKAYVSRETCRENRRKVDISLTEKGLHVFNKAHKKGKESVGVFFKDFLNETESKALFKLLNKIKL